MKKQPLVAFSFFAKSIIYNAALLLMFLSARQIKKRTFYTVNLSTRAVRVLCKPHKQIKIH